MLADLLDRVTAVVGRPAAAVVVCDAARPVLAVGRWRHGGAELQAPGVDALGIVLNLSDGQRVERRTRGGRVRAPGAVGSVTVADPLEPTAFAVAGRAHVVQVFLPLALVTEAAAEAADARAGRAAALPLAVRPRFQADDPVLARAALRALAAMEDVVRCRAVDRGGDPADDLRLTAIAYELARHFAAAGAPRAAAPARGGLTRAARGAVDALVAARLAAAASPTLGEMADAAGVSVYHFAREFRRACGETPHAYVLRRRLEAARDLLARSTAPVADVGRRTGFTSPAHFAARFRRQMGVTPREFRDAVRR